MSFLNLMKNKLKPKEVANVLDANTSAVADINALIGSTPLPQGETITHLLATGGTGGGGGGGYLVKAITTPANIDVDETVVVPYPNGKSKSDFNSIVKAFFEIHNDNNWVMYCVFENGFASMYIPAESVYDNRNANETGIKSASLENDGVHVTIRAHASNTVSKNSKLFISLV